MLSSPEKATSKMRTVEKFRKWVFEERQLRGWSRTKLAEEARMAARQRNVESNLKQQSISAFELGQIKSIPSWMPYVMAAFESNPTSPTMNSITSTKCNASKNIGLPEEKDLKKLFLGLLTPVEEDITPQLKRKIASILAQRLPKGLEQISLFQ
ncbi:hypothetical protein A265_01780 (plasmid) [Zymomonas mobilis subsp. mobilis str. CP4 = NRRL B-14023]|uniref:Uncharacterized protein n=2 Tax=Zymomonas mobilis TaxID=542 RepID=A0A806CJS1_ZYMMO|nr:hypothetical protein [Zymomonas mobilis]ADC33842.1 hypothetical protein ZZM4_0066 [Zymomonas mobilis subsp. mobilis ZM4 = ATCC 31821]AHB11097.1 hypothetical protein ZCP4_1838 [Zymomonas mobilis subsp. mobilis str. CP4 = NRRL B-14023]AHJ71353.1 hypothetical protein A254_01770 [Zymomonas mobilis subsp. mobilis NRRL B-12526]AHJ73217.1 hypothetical protein A265_01780 [Zymomonas mobilis subsp. mobilis str. CP4 = NRRL B-14023]